MTLTRPQTRRLEDLHESYQKTYKKIFNCHANERQMDSNQTEGKEGQEAAGFPYGRVWYMLAPATRGAQRSVEFYHNSNSKPLGKDQP